MLLNQEEYQGGRRSLNHCSVCREHLPSSLGFGGLGLSSSQGMAEVPEPLSWPPETSAKDGAGLVAP